MVSDIRVRLKKITADMGSGIIVIAGITLAITMVFIYTFSIWNIL